MTPQSDRLQQRMRELSHRFAGELPSRLSRLEQAIQAYNSRGKSDARFEARIEAHKLAGAAGSFGYSSLSSAARELELYLDSLEEDGSAELGERFVGSQVDVLLERVRHAITSAQKLEELGEAGPEDMESDASSEAEPDPGSDLKDPDSQPETVPGSQLSAEASDREVPAGERSGMSGEQPLGEMGASPAADPAVTGKGDAGAQVVILLGSHESAEQWQEVETQLGYFGFAVQITRTFGELEAFVSRNDIAVSLADVTTLGSVQRDGLDLYEMGRENSCRLSIIAVSEEDSFEKRLEAVRNGAQAFLDLPIDIPRLIDRIQELQRQAMPDPLHVLIIDDDAEQVSQIAYILQQDGMVTSVASDPTQIFSLMAESKPDLVVTDMYMPGCTGIELARLIRQQDAFVGIPIIFLSVEDDVDKHMDAMSHGGDDFIVKPVNPGYLVAAVRIRANRTREMRFFMERDSLTGLLNHSHLKQQLEREVERAERIGRPVSFAMIDIDHFKEVNDRYGHLIGDRVLKSLSRLLHERLRRTDTIGRYGGEEFGIVLFDADGLRAAHIMDELRESFARIVHHDVEDGFHVTFSCGIATYPDVIDATVLAELADRSLYQAKRTGRNRVVSV